MPVINVYNEDEKCDDCGNGPVEFIISDDYTTIKRLCQFCFAKEISPPSDENKNVSNDI